MAFIETPAEDEVTTAAAEMYRTDRELFGYVPNLTRAFAERPAVYAAWRQLNGAIKGGMELRRYELATLAAARRLQSSYCMLAHGEVVLENFMEAEELRNLVTDGQAACLDETDVAIMELAEQVVDDATSIGPDDFERLRALGLTDADILDVVLAAAARCFFSKTLDALGVQPDARFAELDPALRDALTVGRPIAEA